VPHRDSSAAPGLARLLAGLAGLGAVGAARNAGAQLAAEREAVAAAEARLARVHRARLQPAA
jgi:hypothetical protein